MSRKYYEECLAKLENANDIVDLLNAWGSFDFDNLTSEEQSDLGYNYYKIRDRFQEYETKLDTDYDLADFCRGGDLSEPG